MEIYDVVRKLVGEINPTGETNTDNQRYSNIEVLGELIDKLMQDIDYVANKSEYSYEYSVKRASNFAKKLKYDITEKKLIFEKILSFYCKDGNPEVFKDKIIKYQKELLSE
jgi:hypothetical protein